MSQCNHFDSCPCVSVGIEENNVAVGVNSDGCNNTIVSDKMHLETTNTTKKPLSQCEFCSQYGYQLPQKPNIKDRFCKACECSCSSLKSTVLKRLPIVNWLPNYSIKNDLAADIIAGVTLAVIQIPQALAFTALSSASPVYGLYATFLSTALYFFLGTSKFSSLGLSGVTAVVVGKAINGRLDRLNIIDEADLNETVVDGLIQASNSSNVDVDLIKQQVVTALAFSVGAVQVIMGILNLGYLSIFFSEMVIRACTMAALLQIIIDQIPHLLGITIHRPRGPLSIIYTSIEIIKTVPSTNIATLIISAICIICLVLVNNELNTRYKSKLKIPIPTEILLIMAAIAASYYGGLNVTYGVKILNKIPTGFPQPTLPHFALIPELFGDSLIITILAFTLIMSQAKVLSSKFNCYPDISQELLANGLANVVGSFFSSMPSSFAFVRSLLLIRLKARSMLCSIVCAITILLVLLFIAPVFEPLPHSVLVAILVVAIAEILKDLKLIKTTWKSVKADSLLISGSFIAVFLLDLQYGIAIGVSISMLMVLYQTIRVKITTLGCVEGTDIYLEPKKFTKSSEISGIKILSMGGPLFFGTKDALKKKVDKKVIRVIAEQRVRIDSSRQNSTVSLVTNDNISQQKKSMENDLHRNNKPPAVVLILDFSVVTFLDTPGLQTLSLIKDDLSKVDGILYIAAVKDKVQKVIERSEFSTKFEQVFPSVHDAVLSARLLWASQV